MDMERTKRSLKAIFSADVKGFSRLMGEDELGTVNRLKQCRRLITGHLERCNGCLVDSPGDNILAEFTSVVDALECAVNIQKEMKTLNETLSPNKKMAFRIGVNLGDVIEDNDRIYGDGVNVAARIESLAEPGGICISRTVFDQIGKKLPFGYAYLGEHSVKNIEKPVRVYRVLTEPEAAGKVIGEKRFLGRVSRRAAKVTSIVFIIAAGVLIGWNIYLQQSRKIEPADPNKMAYPLPEKPSIAVLPFVNMSDDKRFENFGDGLVEEIITALAKVPELFVIARESTFSYKGKPVKVQQVSEALGVRFVLEGSVRKEDDRVRVTAQLIDAIKGIHLWAERYDRELNEIFSIQEEITLKILSALLGQLTYMEAENLFMSRPENLDAFLKSLAGWKIVNTIDVNLLKSAEDYFEEAIALDPKYANAYLGLALTNGYKWTLNIMPEESLRQAFECLDKARSMDDSLALIYGIYEWMYNFLRQNEKAIESANKALKLAPGSAYANFSMGRALNLACRDKEALLYLEKAVRMNPFPPGFYFMHIGAAHFNLKNHKEAVSALKRSLAVAPRNIFAWPILIYTYVEMGRIEEALAERKEFEIIYPPPTPRPPPEIFRKTMPWKDRKIIERYVAAERKIRVYMEGQQ